MTNETAAPIYGYTANGEALIRRLHRIEGQVRGIEKLLEQDRHCTEDITRSSALKTVLEPAAFTILDEHVNRCMTGALASGDEEVSAEKSRGLLAAVDRVAGAR